MAKIGVNNLSKAFIGNQEVKKVYLGSDLIYQAEIEPSSFDNITINYTNDNSNCSIYYKLNNGTPVLVANSSASGTITLNNVSKLEIKNETYGMGSIYVDGTDVDYPYWEYDYMDITSYLQEGSIVEVENDD